MVARGSATLRVGWAASGRDCAEVVVLGRVVERVERAVREGPLEQAPTASPRQRSSATAACPVIGERVCVGMGAFLAWAFG
jgi:hypothetical protein